MLRLRLILLALVCVQISSWLVPALAHAEGCPGSGGGACPYAGLSTIGNRAEGVLRFPEAVAVAPSGNIYIADQLGYTVQEFTPTGTLVAEWGSYGGGHSEFGPIGGIATDPSGDVYVVDSSHDRIEKFTAGGAFIRAWGKRGSEVGQFNFGSSQDPTKPPGGGIAVTASYVFVADSSNDRIERFNLEGGEPMAWGTKGSEPGQFSYPRGLAANASEVVVTDDDNHRIEVFNSEGAYVGTTGSYGAGPGQFGFPYGVALDAAGNVYVADDINDRVVKLNPQLAFVGAWGGFGSKPGQLAYPRGLASDPAGDTYVADTANGRIDVFDPNGNYLRSLGIDARGPGELTAPRGLALDPAGGLLVADTDASRIELFASGSDAFAGQWTLAPGRFPALNRPTGIGVDPAGSVYVGDVAGNERIARFWGDGTPLSEIGGPAALGGASLAGSAAIAVSPTSHDVYVADSAHNRILVYSSAGRLLARWGAGEGDGTAGSGSGGFANPQALAIGPSGDIYVADTGNDRVAELEPSGRLIDEWGTHGTAPGQFRGPDGIGVDGAGTVYVLDGEDNRVEAFTAYGHYLFRWGERGAGPGQLSFPAALAVGCEGDVYVADTDNNRIERFEPASRHGIGCLPTAAWPPPLDVPPVLTAKLERATGVLAHRAVLLELSCQRGCKVLVTATLAPLGGHSAAVRLAPVARGLPARITGHLRLRLGLSGLGKLRRELGRRHGMRVRITVVAQGPTGRRTTARLGYLVTR